MEQSLTAAPTARGRRGLLAVWLVVVVLFGGLLLLAQARESSLDDPDPAWQRPGFLDAGALPQPAPRLGGDLARPGRRAVVFFVHPDGVAGLCGSLAGHELSELADLALVVSGPGRCEAVTTLEDPSGRLARAYGLRRPRGGWPPVGYAVVDRRGQIRYRTLDPTVADALGEVETIVRATP